VEAWSGYDEGIRIACETVPLEMPDEVFCYSDINFILLGELVQQVTGKGLEVFAKEVVFGPLGMEDTGFRPDGALRERIAATEKDEAGVMLCGVVHDPTARRMGGVAGHAGLFSTVRDVARYARCVISGGELDGKRVLKPETVELMTRVATPNGMVDLRALGWDVDTKFSRPRGGFPVGRSFGHTGFTGCCVWLDPGAKAFFVFLSNRLHETDPKSDSRALYEVLGGHASRA
jgi:CubicO group peptidase (beta-lactamase class C family)